MDTLVLKGKTYVKASVAAKNLGYTSDYVGQLCRAHKIDAQLVGRTWYVDTDQLSVHRVEKKRMSRIKAREQVRKSLEEHRAKGLVKHESRVSYEQDESELIPSIKKLTIESEKAKPHFPQKHADEPRYEVENKGNKIVLSGTLDVVDLNDENALEEDTTILKPKIIRKKKIEESAEPVSVSTAKPIALAVESTEETDRDFIPENIPGNSSSLARDFNFIAKLENRGVTPVVPETEDTENSDEIAVASAPHVTVTNAGSGFVASSIIIILACVLAVLPLVVKETNVYAYDTDGIQQSSARYSIDTYFIKKLIK